MEMASWVEDFLLALLRTPTQVPLGETEIQPGDPRIVRAVETLVVPEIEALAPDEVRRHPKGDLLVRFGPDSPDGVLLQTYIVSQHANLMADPSESRIADGAEFGVEGPCAVGQGATQSKGPMAAALAAVRGVASVELRRPVWLAINTEGRSSHGGSIRILDDLGVTASCGIVAFGTDMKVSLGNRGRADVEILVGGKSSHSSQPWLGRNPIEAAADAVAGLRQLPLPPSHPVLGKASATPYQFACHPVAPHTIPESVRIVVDRRLLPGEDAPTAVQEVKQHLGNPDQLKIELGSSLLPAEVDADEVVVTTLLAAIEAADRRPETFWSLNAFDAGYACSKGIPTPMFGPGKRSFVGAGLVGTDMIPISECIAAANILEDTLLRLSGAS